MSPAMQDAIELRRKCPQFRILVLGRANAGKTTLLKKVCESIEDPEIYGPDNERASRQRSRRGIHEIELQLIFKSNPGFIFHDSRGFESGSADEVATVKHFIAKRAATRNLPDQLHAIWYCLPTDTPRPLMKADEDFFSIDFEGKVPVIAIFTKLDGLANRALTRLCDDGYDTDDALQHVPSKAMELLETNFKAGLRRMPHPPSDYVQLEDMRQTTSDCKDLIEKTAESITDDGLRMLLVSVQCNNIALCIHYAVENAIERVTISACTHLPPARCPPPLTVLAFRGLCRK
ncbi:GTP-binding protein [Mycena alexandri]|uniref:GTP-binding protein n=1 Tax=Mycena alexandri TaxID=1745969 RepID=A0AAD6SFP2_9AGAR|nr:GTP-binding protein [Mycena alexandri]